MKAIPIILLVIGIGFPNIVNAQDSIITYQQAVELAKLNYPTVKAAQLEVDKQKALKSTAWNLGNTLLYTGREEAGNGFDGIQTNIGIGQEDIDIFSIPAKNKLANQRTKLALTNQNLTEVTLVRDVSIAYFRVTFAYQQWQLLNQIDTLYSDFLRAAELRYKTQQTSRIEFLAASSRYKELQVNLRRAEGAYDASIEILNQYLMISTEINIDVNSAQQNIDYFIPFEDSISSSPLLMYFSDATDMAESAWKAKRTGYFPKINLSYAKQTVEGTSGFYAYQAGISFPLLFFTQQGITKAAKLNYEITAKAQEEMVLETTAEYSKNLINFQALKDVLEYYKNEALPLANEQIQATNLAYRLGSIDYVQFIQNIETAINTKNEYLQQQLAYFELATEIKYQTGN
jgi:cobalt-zinc-cadmium resistance protein CzcA